jgi:DHA2 family multidrug resistance protein-like MFS transporter
LFYIRGTTFYKETAMALTARHRWTALGVLCLAVLLVGIDNTIVNVALPSISGQLSAGTSGLQWVVDAYTLVFAGLLLGFGHLGDRFGRRRTLLVGIAGFGAVSIVAATAGTLGVLIGARAVMGAFAALIYPATLALLTNIFTDARERVAAVGLWSAVTGVSVAVGPVTGGWLLEHFSWGSVFWVNLPMAFIALAATARFVPESRDPHVGRLDWLGVVLSIAGISLVVWAVIEGPHRGWSAPVELGAFVGAAVLLAGFIGWERRCTSPVLDVRLFANRRFSAAAGAISIAFFGLFGFIFLITQYFQVVKGYSTLSAGVRTLPFAIVIGVLAPIAVQLAQRFGSTVVVAAGLVLMSAGFGLASTTAADSAYWGKIIVAMVLMAAGLGLLTGPATESIMGALPREQAGAGSAVNDTTRELGGTLGVAVLGSILAAIYRAHLTPALHAAGLSDQLQARALSSVTGGFQVASRSGSPALVHSVQTAFVDGVNRASLVAALACLLGAVLVALALPARARTSGNAAVQAQADGHERGAELVVA